MVSAVRLLSGAPGLRPPPPLLRLGGRGRARGIPPVPALPSRARARAHGRRRVVATRTRGGSAHRRWGAERPQRGRLGAWTGSERAPPAARARARDRRLAPRPRADASPAAGQAPARRYRPPGDARRVRERLPKPTPLQRGVPRAVRHAAGRFAARSLRPAQGGGVALPRGVPAPHAGLPPAARVAFDFSPSPFGSYSRRRSHRGGPLRPHRADRRTKR